MGTASPGRRRTLNILAELSGSVCFLETITEYLVTANVSTLSNA